MRHASSLTVKLSHEAQVMYDKLDAIATDHWQPFAVLKAKHLRTAFHELGSCKLLASYSTPDTGIHWFSRWRNRYNELTTQHHLWRTRSVSKLVLHYDNWTVFSFDHFGMVLRQMGIETEALFQINHAYLCAVRMGLIESQKCGTEIRVTQEALNWIATSQFCSNAIADRVSAQVFIMNRTS